MTRCKRLSAALVTAAALAIPTPGAVAAKGTPDTPQAFPEGVYRAKITRDDILRAWPNADDLAFRSLAGTWTHTFRGGSWSQVISTGGMPGCRRVDGRYSVE